MSGLNTSRNGTANALNASATIFESMAEVDSKFAKFADKECDGVSAEVKKWFKKLAVCPRHCDTLHHSLKPRGVERGTDP